jgi:uncharacterized phage-associated protein
MYNAISIASLFVQKGIEDGRAITPMQANKLVFLSHGWHLAFTDQPLICEQVEAWPHGPVVPSIYHHLKRHKGNPIPLLEGTGSACLSEMEVIRKDPQVQLLLDSVWKGYGHRTGVELSTITHKQGSPWHMVWVLQGGRVHSNTQIPNLLIRDYYRSIYLQKQCGTHG